MTQVVMTAAQRERFEEWLASRGCELARIPLDGPDLPTFCITPTDEMIAALARDEPSPST